MREGAAEAACATSPPLTVPAERRLEEAPPPSGRGGAGDAAMPAGSSAHVSIDDGCEPGLRGESRGGAGGSGWDRGAGAGGRGGQGAESGRRE